MDDNTTVLLGVFVLSILLSAFFAASETALSMANRIRLKNLSEHGDKKAGKALILADEESERTLITLLILTNVAHMAAASVATVFVSRIWGNAYISACTFVTTFIMFIIGETIPKNYATSHADSFSVRNAGILTFLVKVLRPLSGIFSFISTGLSRLLPKQEEPSVNEEDLYEIIDNIQEEGVIEKEKTDLIQSALEFDDTTVQDVLTPRIRIVGIDDEMTPDEIIERIKESNHSRLPVYHGSIDHITGILSIRKYIRTYLELKEDTPLYELCEKPCFVYKTMPIDELLRTMSSKRINVAVVNDEYGGTAGIVTVEDVLEELVGEIWDEDDVVRHDFVPLGGDRFEVSADLEAADMFELMKFEDYDEEDFDHKTVGAWALENFDCMPQRGDSFSWNGLEITVSEATKKRIVKVRVKYEKEENGNE